MYNKKGGVAINEIRGILTYMFVAVIAILIFYGCNVNAVTKKSEKAEDLTEEIEATKALNLFLKSPVDEDTKVSEFIVELYIENSFEGSDRSKIEKLDETISEFLANTNINANIIIFDIDNNRELYNSRTFGSGRIVEVSESKIAVSLDPKLVQILFQLIRE